MKKFCAFVLFCSLAFSACIKPDIEDSNAKLMVVHASPNTPDVDLLIDNKPIILQPLQYLNNIYYRTLLAGDRNFKVKVGSNTIIDTNLNFNNEKTYSIFIIGDPIDVRMVMYEDDLFNPASSGQFKMRFLNLVTDVNSVDLSNVGDSTVHFDNVQFGEMRDFKIFGSGIYNFALKQPGTQNSIYNSPNDTLENGKLYTAFANGVSVGTNTDSIGVWIISNGDF